MRRSWIAVLPVLFLALAVPRPAEARCDAKPMFCNYSTQTSVKILVVCTPKDDFTKGGYVTFGSEKVSLQEDGGTATASTTVSCTKGTNVTIDVYDNKGNKTSLGSFKAGKTDKSGNIEVPANVVQAGVQSLGRSDLLAARETVEAPGCPVSVLLDEEDTLEFEAELVVEESPNPELNYVTLTYFHQVFASQEVCGVVTGLTTVTLDPDYVSDAYVFLDSNTLSGTFYFIADVEGLGVYTSQEAVWGTFDPDSNIVNLHFDGDFEPWGVEPIDPVPVQEPATIE